MHVSFSNLKKQEVKTKLIHCILNCSLSCYRSWVKN